MMSVNAVSSEQLLDLPSDTGIYALTLSVDEARDAHIGRFGVFKFPRATYVYVGSARGPGGIRARLGRHIENRGTKPFHWHIDWLRSFARPVGIVWSNAAVATECAWAAHLEALGWREPAGFGASDCRCEGHLIRLHFDKPWTDGISLLKLRCPGQLGVVRPAKGE